MQKYLIADLSKIGTAILIKFGDSNDSKKKRFLHLTRVAIPHPLYNEKFPPK